MTETTIWDIEEHRREPPGIRDLDFRESSTALASTHETNAPAHETTR